MSVKRVLFCLFLLFGGIPSALWGAETVTAKGVAFFEPGREPIAREKALDEAKRAAVEQAVGTTVESRSAVENFRLVHDRVLSRASGYIKRMKILDEKKTDLGTYEITIEAVVETSALVDDLDRFNNMMGWQKNPRVAVVVDPGLNHRYAAAAKRAVDLLSAKMKDKGFTVFRYTRENEAQMGLVVSLILALSTKKTDYQGLGLTLNEIVMSADIHRPGDDEVLATAGAVKSLPGENRLNALDEGTKACIDAIWNELQKKLVRLWEKELYSERDITVVVKKVPSHSRAQKIAEAFKSDVSGMVDARLLRFSKKSAVFGIKYKGWPESLLSELQMSYFEDKYFTSTVETMTGNKIVLNITTMK